MINIIPDEVPEIADKLLDSNPTYEAKGGALGAYVGRNVFVTTLDGRTLVGLCLRAKQVLTYTVGQSDPISQAVVESVREV